MDAFDRLHMFTLLGELLIGHKSAQEVEREYLKILADEKTRSYEIGVADGRKGAWG